jgi:hypothetical protein
MSLSFFLLEVSRGPVLTCHFPCWKGEREGVPAEAAAGENTRRLGFSFSSFMSIVIMSPFGRTDLTAIKDDGFTNHIARGIVWLSVYWYELPNGLDFLRSKPLSPLPILCLLPPDVPEDLPGIGAFSQQA